MAVVINNEDIKNTFHYVISIETALKKELAHVEGNKTHLDKLVPDYLKGVYSKKQNDAVEFKTNLIRTAYDSALVLLVASFERIMFAKYKTVCSQIEFFLEANKDLSVEYFIAKERFVNNSFTRLADLIKLIEGKIDGQLYDNLSAIKEHRNCIAHGSREGLLSAVDMTIEEIAQTLDSVITQIEIKH
jgi:hypothetical protein